MSKIKIAEIFHSLQGEGLYTGVPSVFVRTFGCNFECRGFGLPVGEETTEPEEIAEQLKEHPEWDYTQLPLTTFGCDSYASWHPKFKSLSPTMSVDVIVDEMEKARIFTGAGGFNEGETHLVMTGGEPLLGWQRAYPELFEKVHNIGYKHITFETNGTQPIKDKFSDFLLLEQIRSAKHSRSLTFSVSPKIGCSGEKMEEALQPEIVVDYQRYGNVYLKFVVGHHSDMRDVLNFVAAYREAGFRGEVFLMPVGGDPVIYNVSAPEVAKLCMVYGFRYSPRLQVDLWKNEWGT